MKLKHLLLALCLTGWLLLTGQAPTAVHAASITVYPGEVAIDPNDGRCSLREAIINANNNAATHPDCPAGTGDDTIIIPAGTYTLSDATAADEDFSVTGDLDIRSNLTLQGAGAGTTILDGNSADRVLHVVSGVVVVNDVTIRNGLTPNGADDLLGCPVGGYCLSTGEHGSPGGGISNEGDLTLNRVFVADNQTGAGGAGGNINCSFDYCRTSGGAGGPGAGIHSSGPSLTIHNSVIQHNQTGNGGAPGANNCTVGATCSQTPGDQGNGGGIDLDTDNTLTLTLSHLTNNSGGSGGGMYCWGACTITHSVIQDNTATQSGGGLYLNHNSPKVVSHTTVANNTARGNGGGIYANQGTVTITNVTLSGNASNTNGGGIYNNSATITLNHVSIVNNTADADNNGSGNGGGLFRVLGPLNLRNSVVADNVDTGGQAPDCAGTITTLSYNHIETLAGCTFTPGTGDVTGSDPNLGLLADNGGIGQTHRPNVGSPLLNSIPFNTNDCGDVITLDQRGAARPFPAGGSCDKGAVEARTLVQNCSLSTGSDIPINGVTLNFTSLGSLSCVSVEEMGSNHPAATGSIGNSGIHTGNWWHISGNVGSGFEVTVTLPHSGLADPQVCKYPGTQGGYGWDCARTNYNGSMVWLDGMDSFSDWAVGDEVGPTAVFTLHADVTPATGQGWLVGLLAGLLGATTAVFLRLRRHS